MSTQAAIRQRKIRLQKEKDGESVPDELTPPEDLGAQEPGML